MQFKDLDRDTLQIIHEFTNIKGLSKKSDKYLKTYYVIFENLTYQNNYDRIDNFVMYTNFSTAEKEFLKKSKEKLFEASLGISEYKEKIIDKYIDRIHKLSDLENEVDDIMEFLRADASVYKIQNGIKFWCSIYNKNAIYSLILTRISKVVYA